MLLSIGEIMRNSIKVFSYLGILLIPTLLALEANASENSRQASNNYKNVTSRGETSKKKNSSIKICGEPKATSKAIFDSNAKQKLTVVTKKAAPLTSHISNSKTKISQIHVGPIKPNKNISSKQQGQVVRQYRVEQGSVKPITQEAVMKPAATAQINNIRHGKSISPGAE